MPRTLYERAGETLTYMFDTSRRLLNVKDYNNADRVEIAASSIREVLKNRGVTCGCGYVGTGKAAYLECECKPTRSGGKKKKALSDTDLNDIHCRDGSGAFVPIPRCKGPVGRDPDTGKYISIK